MITRTLFHALAAAGLACAAAACGDATSAAPTAAAASTYTVVVAHRTDAGHAPENTVAGIWAGAKTGADRVEFDVQESSDGHLVLMHDVTLTRTTNAEQVYPNKSPWRVGDFTLAQLQRLDAGDGEHIPTLAAALDASYSAGLGVLLECKNPGLYPDFASRVTSVLRHRPYWDTTKPGRLLLTSLDHGFLAKLHRSVPYRLDALFIHPVTRTQMHTVAGYAWGIGITAADTGPQVITNVAAERLHLVVGQTNTVTEMQRILDLHPYAISSNYPDQVLTLEGR